jgi:hypothetical protein
MSEQNILNPSQTSLLNPDWGYTEGLPEMRSIFQARSGNLFTRQNSGLGRTYDLEWHGRDLATKHALQQWDEQYRNDFFTFADWERGRYFSGRFAAPLTFSPRGNQTYDVKGQFVELPGAAMYAYAADWTRDAIFLEERNGFGEDLVKLLTPGNWTFLGSQPFAHGGKEYFSAVTNETAEWIYFGYGCSVWCLKGANSGIMGISVIRLRDGVYVYGETNFDAYSASDVASAPIAIIANLVLDLYRVKLRVTGTKNGSSSGFVLDADAIQVMR